MVPRRAGTGIITHRSEIDAFPDTAGTIASDTNTFVLFDPDKPTVQATERSARGVSGFAENTVEFFKGIVTTFRCKPFVKLCAATFLVFNGFQLGISFALYVMIYYVFGGEKEPASQLNGWFGTLTALCTVGVIPLTALISEWLGKRKTMRLNVSLEDVRRGLVNLVWAQLKRSAQAA